MKGLRDWFFPHLVSKAVVSARPLSGSDSFLDEEPLDEEEFDGQGETQPSTLVAPCVPLASRSSDGNQENHSQSSPQQVLLEHSDRSHNELKEKMKDPLVKIEDLKVKFLRLLRRLGLPENNILVAKVLYRIHLATLIRAEESDLRRINLRSNRARATVADQETASQPELDFSIRILVLGKTGVGKSATINSIFDQTKAATDAFRPATDDIREVVGTMNGIKITIIDTPGLLPLSASNVKRNKKVMLSVKRFIKKSPPDIVLYFNRLDLVSKGYNDYPHLKLITEVFGPAIWFNTILVMTHSSSAPPEGPDGYSINYDFYATHCTDLVKHHIHQAVLDSKLENPVLLVENHPQCRKNNMGEKILPNGQVWRSQFLLLCICTKVLSDVNIILKLQESIELGPASAARLPSLPHLLSSLLRERPSASTSGADNEIDESSLSDGEEEDEYDQLPPIRILKNSQFEKLTKSQKKEYLDELDYRETLYLKKQLKEEIRRQRENRLSKGKILAGDDDSDSRQHAPPEDVLLPDMAVPPSFDSNCHAHRYRCLVTSDQWLVRPVLDPQGWDHDVGFDGISLETAMGIKQDVSASITGQMSKDKQDFSVQSECTASYCTPEGDTHSVGLDVQSSGKDLMYTLQVYTKLRKVWHNLVNYGVSLTSFGNKYYVGAKIGDTISVGKRLKFAVNAGRMGRGQVAYGGSFEATLRGRDYPVRNDMVSLTMTLLSFNKEMVLGGNLQSEFQLNRNLRLAVNANINSQKMGQVCVKASSSEHLQIALIWAFTLFKALSRRRGTVSSSGELEEDR